MPVEIKELYIKASVVDTKHVANSSASLSQADLEKMKKEVIKTCVQEVIQLLDDKKER